MGATLRIASDRAGYALTDRATFLQFQPSLRLAIVHEGGAELLNTYACLCARLQQGTIGKRQPG